METDVMHMDLLVVNDETHEATSHEQHQKMDNKTAKESYNVKLRFQILSVLLCLLIVVLIILLLVFRSNFMFRLHQAEEKIHQLTQIHQKINHPDNITQEIIAVQNNTVPTAEEKLNLEGLLLDQSFNIWEIQGLYGKLFGEPGEILSHVFPVEGYEFPAQVKLKWNRHFDKLEFEFSFKFNGSESTPPIVESPLVVYIFEDRSRNETKRNLIVVQELDIPSLTQSLYHNHYTTFLDKLKAERDRYFIDDVTYIKIVVEDPRHVTESVQSYNGTLSWTIDNYRSKRKMEKERFLECQYSVPFYSGKPGYRMRLHAHTWNIYNSAAGLTLRLRISTGLWDQSLADWVAFRIEITIEDQSSNTVKNHIKKCSTKKGINNNNYYIESFTHNEIKDGVHLVNDSLSIKVAVQTL